MPRLSPHYPQVHDFLLKLNRRPFIIRFLHSNETQQEIGACDQALGYAMQMFSVRVNLLDQIHTSA
jgi:hypothetical protein